MAKAPTYGYSSHLWLILSPSHLPYTPTPYICAHMPRRHPRIQFTWIDRFRGLKLTSVGGSSGGSLPSIGAIIEHQNSSYTYRITMNTPIPWGVAMAMEWLWMRVYHRVAIAMERLWIRACHGVAMAMERLWMRVCYGVAIAMKQPWIRLFYRVADAFSCFVYAICNGERP